MRIIGVIEYFFVCVDKKHCNKKWCTCFDEESKMKNDDLIRYYKRMYHCKKIYP